MRPCSGGDKNDSGRGGVETFRKLDCGGFGWTNKSCAQIDTDWWRRAHSQVAEMHFAAALGGGTIFIGQFPHTDTSSASSE